MCPPFVRSTTPDPYLMDYLQRLFETHGATAEQGEDWIIVDRGKLRCQACLSTVEESPEGLTLLGEFGIDTMVGPIFREEFLGAGPDRDVALADLCNSFQIAVFHTAFAGLLKRESCQVEVERWEIQDRLREVTLGPMGCRGEPPFGDDWTETYQAIEKQIRNSDLRPGIHGIRYHYVHPGQESPTLQVTLDNRPWNALQEEAAGFAWPVGNESFSIRLFFLIQDAAEEDVG